MKKRLIRHAVHIAALFAMTSLLVCVIVPGSNTIPQWAYILYSLYLSISVYLVVPRLFRSFSTFNALQATLSALAWIGITLIVYPFPWESRYTDWRYYMQVSLDTLAIGFIPFVCYAIYRKRKRLLWRIQALFHHHHGVKPITSALTTDVAQNSKGLYAERTAMIQLTDENGLSFSCPVADFVYAESQKNYTAICYCEHGTVQRVILRISLKAIEDTAKSNEHIFRSHRSFIVNLKYVLHAYGNSNGYQIALQNCSTVIPVSRSYVDRFLSLYNPA